MQALVFYGTGDKRWECRPLPTLKQPTDAIVRMERTTICGTDLHILKGYVPTVTSGRIIGHEGVGTITALGSGVSQFHVGDRVLISCISSCGKCGNCKKGFYGHCEAEDGGWVLGNTCDGCQAEQVILILRYLFSSLLDMFEFHMQMGLCIMCLPMPI
jgi:alcohol dehydrogenase